mgnify:CR=1 FL=1
MKTRLSIILVILILAALAGSAVAKGPTISPQADDPGGGGGECVECVTCWQPNSGQYTTRCQTGSSCAALNPRCPAIPPPLFWQEVGRSCVCD